MFAVYSTFIIWLKNSCNLSVTSNPISVGTNFFSSIFTYPLSFILPIIVAYVLGLPIPSSSIALTSFASVYLAGGCVKCCSLVISLETNTFDL